MWLTKVCFIYKGIKWWGEGGGGSEKAEYYKKP